MGEWGSFWGDAEGRPRDGVEGGGGIGLFGPGSWRAVVVPVGWKDGTGGAEVPQLSCTGSTVRWRFGRKR